MYLSARFIRAKHAALTGRLWAALSTSPLANMPKKLISFLLASVATLIAGGQVAAAGTESGLKLLKELRRQLDSTRALPRGSKAPRPEQDLSSLVGVSRSEVAHILGLPSYCGQNESWSNRGSDCGGRSPWKYSWGPPGPEPDSAGPGKVVVTAGGPWLLVVTFSADRISSAKWLPQE
jgi:hypothetical protein